MGTHTGPKPITDDSLIVSIDVANPACWNGGNTTLDGRLVNMARKDRKGTLSGNNGVSKGGSGKDSYAYFDGVDNFIYAVDGTGTQTKYNRTQGHYTEAWFRFPSDASTSWHGLFGRGVGDGGYLMLHTGKSAIYHTVSGGSGKLKYSSGTSSRFSSSYLFDSTSWWHIGWKYDPSTENSQLYVDGTLEVTHNMTSFLDMTNWSGGCKYIGSGPGRYGQHDMGIFRHYNRALTDDEIYQNFQANRGRYGK